MSTKAGRITIKDIRQGKTAFVVMLYLGKGKHCVTTGPQKVFILGRPRKGMVELRDAKSSFTCEASLTALGVVSDPMNVMTWEEAGTRLINVGDWAGGLFATEKAAQDWLSRMDTEVVSEAEYTRISQEVESLQSELKVLRANLKSLDNEHSTSKVANETRARVDAIEKALRGEEEPQDTEDVLLEEMGDDGL